MKWDTHVTLNNILVCNYSPSVYPLFQIPNLYWYSISTEYSIVFSRYSMLSKTWYSPPLIDRLGKTVPGTPCRCRYRPYCFCALGSLMCQNNLEEEQLWQLWRLPGDKINNFLIPQMGGKCIVLSFSKFNRTKRR